MTGGSEAHLSGKVAVVTGGGRGLGRALALALAVAVAGASVLIMAAREMVIPPDQPCP